MSQQLALPLDMKPKGRREIHEFDHKSFQAELQEMAGKLKVKVKLNRKLGARARCDCRDWGWLFTINPKKIRTQKDLDHVREFCMVEVTW